MSDPDDPGLGIREASKQAIGGRQDVICDFKGSCLDVDRHDSAMVACFDLSAHL
jgi:hypothetical protein